MVGHEAMLQWLHNNGIWPRAVKEVPLGFEVEIHSEEAFYKLMNLNGHFLHGSPTPLRVTGLPISGQFTTEEVANLMKGWLKDKESSREFDRPNSNNKFFARFQCPHPRFPRSQVIFTDHNVSRSSSKDDVPRAQPHHKVHGIHKAQNLEAAKDNPLERAIQHNFRLPKAKGWVRRVERGTTRGAMTIAGQCSRLFSIPSFCGRGGGRNNLGLCDIFAGGRKCELSGL